MTDEKITKDENLETKGTSPSDAESSGVSQPDASPDKMTETAAAEEANQGETPACESSKDGDKKKCKGSAEKQLADENKRLNAKVSELTASLDKSESELAETRDKYLRVLAEYDNFRKRSTKERDGIFTDAYSDALKEILPIIDNLERAAQYTETEQLISGLALIFKSAKETFAKLGVEEFGAAGDEFDPLLHNAVMHCEDQDAGANQIAEVFQKGYRKGDRIIRHAMVKVVN